jgi:trehalose 6-phosphate phosphatase
VNVGYPGTPAGLSALKQLARTPERTVLAFDYDGTLAPIVEDPEAAHPAPGAVAVLQELASLVGSLAVITGRPAETAVLLGGLQDVEGMVVLGLYGGERWQAGGLQTPAAPEGLAEAKDELPRLLERVQAPEGTRIEDKGQAVAVHTRQAADPDDVLELLRVPLGELAERCGLAVEPGRRVIELRPGGMDKGQALIGLVTERSAGVVLYAGDDLGDLAAFDAVEHLRTRGVLGVTVCSASAEALRVAERADMVVEGPDGIVSFLRDLVAVLSA